MAVPQQFRSYHCSIATDSLGGTSIGRVQSYTWTFDTGAAPSYQMGSNLPYVIGEGNRRFSGQIVMDFHDLNEIMTLLTVDPQTADTHYVRYSTGVSGDQNADFTISGVKYVSGTIAGQADGSVIQETYPFEATQIAMAISTV